ncbi:hypothetical protein [Duodenibacillus massiliensis]
MAHRTPKINDTVKFTNQQQAILNDAVVPAINLCSSPAHFIS